MRRALPTLLVGTLLLTACGGETATTTEPTEQESAGATEPTEQESAGATEPMDQEGAGAADEDAFAAFTACLEEQGLQGMGMRGGGGDGGGDGGPPPGGGAPRERPTDMPSDRPSDLPSEGPGERPQQSAEDMEARQACADEAGIDMAPGGRGPGGRPAPEDGSS